MTILRNIIKVTDSLLFKNSYFSLYGNVRTFGSSKVQLPSPPKKPLTAYMMFCKENRKEILKENPSLSNPQQIKILAEKWSHLTEDMKKPYELSARENTQLYGLEHKKFYESLTQEQREELAHLKAKKLQSRRLSRHKKALRDSGLPKAPTSAYALFVQAEAKKKPAVKSASDYLNKIGSSMYSLLGIHKTPVHSEFIKKVADSWNSLPAESKKAYEMQAEQDKVRYAEEIKEWRSKMLVHGDKKLLKALESLKGVRGKGILAPQKREEEEAKQQKRKKKEKPNDPKN